MQPVHSRDFYGNLNTSSIHQPTSVMVRTKYKSKSSKVIPVKQSDGTIPGGSANLLELAFQRELAVPRLLSSSYDT
jgi:hypothetical protein